MVCLCVCELCKCEVCVWLYVNLHCPSLSLSFPVPPFIYTLPKVALHADERLSELGRYIIQQ